MEKVSTIINNKALCLIAALALILFSCSKGGSTQTPAINAELSLNKQTLEYSEKDSIQSVTVQTNMSNYDVTIPSSASWCSYQKNGQNQNIVVQKMPSSNSERKTTVTVSAGSGSQQKLQTIEISQKRYWKLVWEDNFDVDGTIDTTKWSLVVQGSSDWNKYMTPTNEMAYISGGSLIVKAMKDASNIYHTGGVKSSGKFSFKYGKIEVRAKLASGQGTWPAIWMMPQQSIYGGWPKSGEIDIMEHLNSDNKIYQVVHSNYVDNLGQKNNPVYSATPTFNVGAFNTFGIEWFPDKIDFLLNGVISFTYPRRSDISTDQLQWPFDQSFYIILNQALGGSWVGSINDAILPVQTEIDYVKVYGLSNY